jgi:hypothetical protein
VGAGQPRRRAQPGGSVQHALAVVGVHPDLLVLVAIERARLGPHRDRYGDAADVVH